jgi:hypothetical protein
MTAVCTFHSAAHHTTRDVLANYIEYCFDGVLHTLLLLLAANTLHYWDHGEAQDVCTARHHFTCIDSIVVIDWRL